MRFRELLNEMVVRHRDAGDHLTLFAHRDSIWLFNSQNEDPAAFQDLEARTGLRGEDLHDLVLHAREGRPDVLAGHINHGTLTIDGMVAGSYEPESSLLIKKVVRQLGLRSVDVQRMDDNAEDYEDRVYPHALLGRIPDVVFHGTSSRHLPKIMRFGLAPNKNANWGHLAKFDDRVFLTSIWPYAMFHANNQTRNNHTVPVVIATRIPDRTRMTLDWDIAGAMYGPDHPKTAAAGYIKYLPSDPNTQTDDVQQYSSKTDFTRETGVFAYVGRIPSSFFTTFWVPQEMDSPMTKQNCIEIKDRVELWKVIERLEVLGYYYPGDELDDDEDEEDDDAINY